MIDSRFMAETCFPLQHECGGDGGSLLFFFDSQAATVIDAVKIFQIHIHPLGTFVYVAEQPICSLVPEIEWGKYDCCQTIKINQPTLSQK